MPFNPFVAGGGSRIPGLFDIGLDAARRLIQRRIGVEPPGVITTPIDPGTFGLPGPLMAGRVGQQGCGCFIEKQMPAYVRKMKGKAVFHPTTGQFLGCTPKRRSINPMNGRAATRAARRLTSVMKFQKKIQKAVKRACGSRSGGGFRRTTKKSCGR